MDIFELDFKKRVNSAAANKDASRSWRGAQKYRLEARVQELKDETQLKRWECMKGLTTIDSCATREEGCLMLHLRRCSGRRI